MPSQKKARTRKNRPLPPINFSSTYFDIQDSYRSLFSRMGSVILAKHNGMLDEVSDYRNSLQRLRSQINTRISNSLSQNAFSTEKNQFIIEDLNLMNSNIDVLYNFTNYLQT